MNHIYEIYEDVAESNNNAYLEEDQIYVYVGKTIHNQE